jgi:hypothetical protein
MATIINIRERTNNPTEPQYRFRLTTVSEISRISTVSWKALLSRKLACCMNPPALALDHTRLGSLPEQHDTPLLLQTTTDKAVRGDFYLYFARATANIPTPRRLKRTIFSPASSRPVLRNTHRGSGGMVNFLTKQVTTENDKSAEPWTGHGGQELKPEGILDGNFKQKHSSAIKSGCQCGRNL